MDGIQIVPVQEWKIEVCVYPPGASPEFDDYVSAVPADRLRALAPRVYYARRHGITYEGQLGDLQRGRQLREVSLVQDRVFGFWHTRVGDTEDSDVLPRKLMDAKIPVKKHLDLVADSENIKHRATSKLFDAQTQSYPSKEQVRLLSASPGDATVGLVGYQYHERMGGVQVPLPIGRPRSLGLVAISGLRPIFPDAQEFGNAHVRAPTWEDALLEVLRGVGEGLPSHSYAYKQAADLLRVLLNGLSADPLTNRAHVQLHAGRREKQLDAIVEMAKGSDSIALSLPFRPDEREAARFIARLRDAGVSRLLIIQGISDATAAEPRTSRIGDVDVQFVYSKLASHAKLALASNGNVWLGSCNFLSSSDYWEVSCTLRGQRALETISGILDEFSGASWRNVVRLGTWKDHQDVAQVRTLLAQWTPASAQDLDDEDVVELARNMVQALHRCPRIQLLRRAEHRDNVIGLLHRAQQRIALTSDRLSDAGLDKQVARVLQDAAAACHSLGLPFQLAIRWGRDPGFNAHDEDHRKAHAALGGLEAAFLADDRLKGSKVVSIPRPSGPHGNHSKILSIDGRELLVTSMNFLSYAGKEHERTGEEIGVILEMAHDSQDLLGPSSTTQRVTLSSTDPQVRGTSKP